MDHKYFKDKISAYHDAGLNLEEQELLGQHIAECKECAAALAELEAFDRMIEKRSSLKADDYFEQNAKKIEQALGFGQPEQVADIRPEKRSGLWWKMTAAAASVAILAFIALHEEEITEPMTSPQETIRQLNEAESELPESERPPAEAAGQVAPAEDIGAAGQSDEDDADIDALSEPAVRDEVAQPSPKDHYEGTTRSAPVMRSGESEKPAVEPAESVPPSVQRVEEQAPARIEGLSNRSGSIQLNSASGSGVQTTSSGTVIANTRKPDAERLEFWKRRLADLTAAESDEATSGSRSLGFPSDIVPKQETTQSLAEKKKERSKQSAGQSKDVVPSVSRDLILAHYMVASYTADSAEYNKSLSFIRNVAASDSDLAEYAGGLVSQLTGETTSESSE